MAYPGMTACPTLSIVVPVLCGLLCFNIECVSCASYILHKNPESDGDLHEPISDSTPDDLYVNSSPNCCSNASCIYDMVANALQQSPEFDYISSLMLINNGGPPDFIPIEVQVSWREVTNDTTTNQSSNISYVWGVTAAKAVFGPVQDIFPTPSMYNVLLAMLSVVEEAIIPKELISPQADKINTRLQEEHESIILDLSHTCISYSRQMNAKTLNLTIQMCIEEALQLVSLPLTQTYTVIT